MAWFFTPITDEGSRIDPCAAFPFKTGTDAVALMTGPAGGVADDQLVTDIRFLAAITMDAEAVGVVEAAPIPRIDLPVFLDLL